MFSRIRRVGISRVCFAPAAINLKRKPCPRHLQAMNRSEPEPGSGADLYDAGQFQSARDRNRRYYQNGKGLDREGRYHGVYRPKAAMAVIYNPDKDIYYYGYSGTSGGMADGGEYDTSEDGERRYRRLVEGFKNSPLKVWPDESKNYTYEEKRPFCQCAEAAALSLVYVDDDRPEYKNLKIMSFFDERYDERKVKPPCENCKQWVYDTFGTVYNK